MAEPYRGARALSPPPEWWDGSAEEYVAYRTTQPVAHHWTELHYRTHREAARDWCRLCSTTAPKP